VQLKGIGRSNSHLTRTHSKFEFSTVTSVVAMVPVKRLISVDPQVHYTKGTVQVAIAGKVRRALLKQ